MRLGWTRWTVNETQKSTIYLGIMSGTSLDGLDGVAINIERTPLEVLEHRHHAWPEDVALSLLHIAEGRPITIEHLLRASQDVSEAYVRLAQSLLSSIDRTAVKALGMHGQTVWHQPPEDGRLGYSLQLGSPAWVSARIGFPVVGDFRTADMALGGQGAPLVPHAHHLIFSHPDEGRAVVNLGGIANLTGLFPGQMIWASDTGPANMLMDDLARHFSKGRLSFDPEGAHAAAGRNHPEILAQLLADPFFERPFPKSTGRERFGRHFAKSLYHLSWEDASHTAGQLTVEGVRRAVAALPRVPTRVIVAGGGANNAWLLSQLALALDPVIVERSSDHGIDPIHLEAIAFALLAQARIHGQPANLPSATGASAPVLLGVVADSRFLLGSPSAG